MSTTQRTELQALLDRLCVAAKRDGACATGKAVERILDAARAEGRREARAEITTLETRFDLAAEFRVPLDDGESDAFLSVIRAGHDSDRWAVTDGVPQGLCGWVDGTWRTAWDLGRDALFCYDLDEALRVAKQVAEQAAERGEAA